MAWARCPKVSASTFETPPGPAAVIGPCRTALRWSTPSPWKLEPGGSTRHACERRRQPHHSRRSASTACAAACLPACTAGEASSGHRSCCTHVRPAIVVCRCLEVGCGTGYVITSLALLLRQLGAAARLLATDVNAAAAAATAATLAAHGVKDLPRPCQAALCHACSCPGPLAWCLHSWRPPRLALCAMRASPSPSCR
jgi:outer membrane murein-binding lipoprotein Lpp